MAGPNKRKPATHAEKMRRVRVAEEILVRTLTNRRAIPQIVDALGVSAHVAEKLCADVRMIWESEAEGSDRDAKRREMDAYFRTLANMALTKRRVKANPDGTVAFDKNGNPVMEAVPDLKAAQRAGESLARLHGLFVEVHEIDEAKGLAGLVSQLRSELGSGDAPEHS